MKNKSCSSLKKRYGWFYYLRLSLLVLTIWPIVLLLTLTRRLFIYLKSLCISRPIIREPIHFIRSESVKEIDEWNDYDEEKKTQEWLKHFDDEQTLSNARFIAEYNYHLPNQQNNEQNNLTQFPDIPYDDAIQ